MPIDVARLELLARTAAASTSAVRASRPYGPSQVIEAVGFTVADLDRSVRFYTDVLSFALVGSDAVDRASSSSLHDLEGATARTARMRLGEELLELTEHHPAGRAAPADSRSNDRWFQHIAIVVADMERAYQRLVSYGVARISSAPQRLPDWNSAAAGIGAYYFRDPDGHPLELIHFPPDKGDARWHRSTERLFLGIDHTAIVVGDTDASVRFYRDLLGMRVVGRSENFGPEQERLNGVPGSRVRITTLAADSGLKLELLEYVAPRGGRPMPTDVRPNDLVHWETAVTVGDVNAVYDVIRAAGCPLVSRGVSTVRSRRGAARGFLVCDPDGHALRVVGNPTP